MYYYFVTVGILSFLLSSFTSPLLFSSTNNNEIVGSTKQRWQLRKCQKVAENVNDYKLTSSGSYRLQVASKGRQRYLGKCARFSC